MKLNKLYWSNLEKEQIPGNNILPDDELFSIIEKNSSILDLGCGKGDIAELLATKGYYVTGIDINIDSIQKNKKNKSNVKYIQGDITLNLPFDDETFDVIVIGFVLVNIVPFIERKYLIQEITRILKPNGIIWLNEGMISDEYQNRYILCETFIDDDNSFYVFKDSELSRNITTIDQLKKAIDKDQIDRVAHHFNDDELSQLFYQYKIVYKDIRNILSPRSKSNMRSVVMIAKKA